MSAEWAGAFVGIILCFGGFIVWFYTDIDKRIERKIKDYDFQIKNERLHQLEEENQKLKDYAKNSKQ